MKIRGLVNLITGGCSGLGLGTAKHLVSQGGKVVLLDLNQEAGAECVKELGSENSHFIPCDVTNEAQVKKVYEEANKVFGEIRVYVNCAGIARGDMIIKEKGTHDTDIFHKVINVNLFGSFLCTAQAAWHLKNLPLLQNQRGVIINSSSVASQSGGVGYAVYAASKGALDGMLLPIARELGSYKIRVMNIAPGFMKTPMNEPVPQEGVKFMNSLTLQGEMGLPIHFAQVVEAIITNGYLNGTCIKVDDGIIIPKF